MDVIFKVDVLSFGNRFSKFLKNLIPLWDPLGDLSSVHLTQESEGKWNTTRDLEKHGILRDPNDSSFSDVSLNVTAIETEKSVSSSKNQEDHRPQQEELPSVPKNKADVSEAMKTGVKENNPVAKELPQLNSRPRRNVKIVDYKETKSYKKNK